MQLVYFTKHWPGTPVEKLAHMARRIGADGLDLAVRDGHAVNPENVRKALPEAVHACQRLRVSIPMATMPTAPTDPADAATDSVFAACGEAGVRFVKLGYYQHQSGQDYWREVERLRGLLEQIGRLAARHGVVACYHTHSGLFYGSNAAGLMHLLRGQDPETLGAYLDVGHLTLNGEPIPLALDIARDYLQLVGMKAPVWEARTEGGRTVWNWRIVPLTEGLVDCRLAIAELRRAGFDGVLSFHGEYEMPPDRLPEPLRAEIALCRRLLKETA